jgi:hypothetical protein
MSVLSVQFNHQAMFNRKPFLQVLAALMLSTALMLISPSAAFAQAGTPIASVPSWEVASEFNDSANPSGVWSYCTKPTTFATSCSLLSSPYADPLYPTDVVGWTDPSLDASVLHNVNPTPFTNSNYTYPVTLPAHAIALSPGASGQYAVLRFTAPATGSYKVSGQFYALDGTNYGPGIYWNTTDVHIVKNSTTTVFSSNIDYLNGAKWASFTSKTVALKAGNTLDFQVGYGSNGNNYFDTTGLNAVIERIK